MKKDETTNKYMIVSSEPLLIENRLNLIKETLNINEAFDFETFSIGETAIEEILPKLYLSPFASKYRLLIVNGLEDLDVRSLPGISHAVNDIHFTNILVLTYRSEKNGRDSIKRLSNIFTDFMIVDIDSKQLDVKHWIKEKVKKDGINLPVDLQNYLEEEFSNDITGLKQEFDKIQNYLHEASSLNSQTLKDLARGLCDVDKYRIAKCFFGGDEKALAYYQEVLPYIDLPVTVVYALSRYLLSAASESRSSLQMDRKKMDLLLKKMIEIDKKVKTGSYFSNFMLEKLFLQNTSFYKKGVLHGE